MIQNSLKGNIPEHFAYFRANLCQSHGYNTRNGYLPRLPKPRTEWGKRTTYFKAMKDWTILPNRMKKFMPQSILINRLTIFYK